jgi:hypothetical protein
MYANAMPGQIVSVIKAGGYSHLGIYAGDGIVIDCSPEIGVAQRTLRDFAGGQEIRNHGYWGNYSSDIIIRNAFALIGKPYRLFAANCEHFVREVCGLPIRSNQVRNVVFAVVIFGLVWFTLAKAR